MPFLLPFIPLIAAGASTAGSIAGAVGGSNASKTSDAQTALTQQTTQENAQEFSQMEQLFQTLTPFFEQYMGKGSPILNQVQAGAAQDTQHQFDAASAETRQKVNAQGYGGADSGTAAGAEGDLEAARATVASGTFLQNLLANEAVKFQSANSLKEMMSTLKPNQQPPANPTPTTSPFSAIGEGITKIAGALPPKSSGSPGSVSLP